MSVFADSTYVIVKTEGGESQRPYVSAGADPELGYGVFVRDYGQGGRRVFVPLARAEELLRELSAALSDARHWDETKRERIARGAVE